MTTNILRIATRESPLAMWQATHIKEQLENKLPNYRIELLPMKTKGDKFLQSSLATIGGKGLFVKELELALLEGRADIAVHSMKDVPVEFPPGLKLAIICRREDPHDALLTQNYRNFDDLPLGATVGTSSLRRQSQLLALRDDLNILPLRGNVQTRIKHLESGDFDAIILAAAGLKRMQLADQIKQIFSSEQLLPAAGQGALGIECRDGDENLINLLKILDDESTAICVNAERTITQRLGGSCHMPLASYAVIKNKQVHLRTLLASPDGKKLLRAEGHADFENSIALSERLSDELFAQGAQEILDQCHEKH